MITLIIGTHNSGKSLVAEKLSTESGDDYRIYLATMKVMDDAGKERVHRHRKQRQGKGFVTMERTMDIDKVLGEIKDPQNTTVLLECVSNLAGNEMHDNPGGVKSADTLAAEIRLLAKGVHNMIIVTNEYDLKGEGYDADTIRYVEFLHEINDRIVSFADRVIDLRLQNTGDIERKKD
jgi:adenosylcobinamide kinase/adenosylcobinamide-phosphate guanylyltransferase